MEEKLAVFESSVSKRMSMTASVAPSPEKPASPSVLASSPVEVDAGVVGALKEEIERLKANLEEKETALMATSLQLKELRR